MKKKTALWLTLVIVVAGAVGLYAYLGSNNGANAGSTTATTAPAATASAATTGNASIDVQAALAERGLGDPNAPVRIDEYASLTCSHCAAFSVQTFAQLQSEYIDTGKVYFVFNDFPLNAPALDASMIARCLPEGRYFPFIKFLFEKQNDWAFGNNHRAALKQNAKLLGMSDEVADACLANDELRSALVEKMQTVSETRDITSTPSFIIQANGSTDVAAKITGAQPLATFSKEISALERKGAAAPEADTPVAADDSAPVESEAEAEDAEDAGAEAPAATTDDAVTEAE